MSALYTLSKDFKEPLKIPFHILPKNCTENRFNIVIYCKEYDINVKKELEYLNFLFENHDFAKMGHHSFEVKETISLRRDYSSTYNFSSKKNVYI